MTFAQIARLTNYQITQILFRRRPGEKLPRREEVDAEGPTWEEAVNIARGQVGLDPIQLDEPELAMTKERYLMERLAEGSDG